MNEQRLLILINTSYMCHIFFAQTDDYNNNRNQLLVRYSNIIVPIVSMLFKYNWSIFSLILELLSNNENNVFYGLTHFNRIHQL